MYELEKRVDALEYRTSRLEEALLDFMEHTKRMLDRLSMEMLDFKNEMRMFKNEMLDFKEEMRQSEKRAERERREMNKRWGALSNKMGTVVEDIIFPATRPVINKYFKCDPFFLANRVQRKIDNDKREEFDVVATCKDKVFLIEVKITPRPQYIKDLKEKMKRFREFFPEYKDKELVPIYASLSIDDNFVNMLTKEGIYAMAYREWDYMDILNFDKIRS